MITTLKLLKESVSFHDAGIRQLSIEGVRLCISVEVAQTLIKRRLLPLKIDASGHATFELIIELNTHLVVSPPQDVDIDGANTGGEILSLDLDPDDQNAFSLTIARQRYGVGGEMFVLDGVAKSVEVRY